MGNMGLVVYDGLGICGARTGEGGSNDLESLSRPDISTS